MTLDRNAARMGEMRLEYKFLIGKYEGKKKIKSRKMKLEKNEPFVGRMRQKYKFLIGKCERKRKSKARKVKLKKKECNMDGRYVMLIQNVSRKMLRRKRDETKEDEIGGERNMRGRLETLTHSLLGRHVGKRKIKPRKMNLWRITTRERKVRRE